VNKPGEVINWNPSAADITEVSVNGALSSWPIFSSSFYTVVSFACLD